MGTNLCSKPKNESKKINPEEKLSESFEIRKNLQTISKEIDQNSKDIKYIKNAKENEG